MQSILSTYFDPPIPADTTHHARLYILSHGSIVNKTGDIFFGTSGRVSVEKISLISIRAIAFSPELAHGPMLVGPWLYVNDSQETPRTLKMLNVQSNSSSFILL